MRLSLRSSIPLARSFALAVLFFSLGSLAGFAADHVAEAAVSASPKAWRSLFDGTLHDWRSWLAGLPDEKGKPTGAPLGWDNDTPKIFTIVDADGSAAIRAAGPVQGFLITKETFREYHLRLQFKWGKQKWPPRAELPLDSGIHFHVCGEPGSIGGIWVPCLEFQIQEHDCGDLWTLGAAVKTTARVGNDLSGYRSGLFDPAAPLLELGRRESPSNHAVKLADHEKPNGEWNTLELVCFGEDIVYVVNGHVVLRLREPRQAGADKSFSTPLHEGAVALQSEAGEIFFRKIELRTITAIPAEFARR